MIRGLYPTPERTMVKMRYETYLNLSGS